MQLIGEEDGDQADCAQVIHDGKGQQEGPQGRRQVWRSYGQNRQGEGNVGGHRRRPASRSPMSASIEGQIDQGRGDHAAERRHDGQGQTPWVGEFAPQDLELDLQPDKEKEDRHQAVLDPFQGRLRLVEVSDLQGEGMGDESEILGRPG